MKKFALILVFVYFSCIFVGCDYQPQVYSDEFEMTVFLPSMSDDKLLTITRLKEEKEDYFIPKNHEFYPTEKKFENRTDAKIGEIRVLNDFLCFNSQKLRSITFEEGIRIGVEVGCFMNCRNLKEVINAEGIHTIMYWGFMNCVSLANINLDGIEYIGNLAFSGCAGLNYVFLGEKIGGLGYNAFANCSQNLTVRIMAIKPPEMMFGVFDGIENLTIIVPKESLDDYKIAEGWKEYSDFIISEA